MLTISSGEISGVALTTVTDPELDFIRACVAMPFEGKPYRDNDLHEVPHLFEHLACYDSTLPIEDYTALVQSKGGHINGHTTPNTHGLVSFETVQPKQELSLVLRWLQNTVAPNIAQAHIETQRVVVTNEIARHANNADEARESQRSYDLGLTYRTDAMALRTIPNIDEDHLISFQNMAYSVPNLRLIFSGNNHVVAQLKHAAASIVSGLPSIGRRYFTDSSIKLIGNYHLDVPDMQEGVTSYWYRLVSESPFRREHGAVFRRVITQAFGDAINNGSEGVHTLSRQRGLSYGMSCGVLSDETQIGLSFRDTVDVKHVQAQISLVAERLQVLSNYDKEDFQTFREKTLGNLSIYPSSPHQVIQAIEDNAGDKDPSNKPYTQDDYKRALTDIEPSVATKYVHQISDLLLNSNLITHSTFGENFFGV